MSWKRGCKPISNTVASQVLVCHCRGKRRAEISRILGISGRSVSRLLGRHWPDFHKLFDGITLRQHLGLDSMAPNSSLAVVNNAASQMTIPPAPTEWFLPEN
jgi:hypothetical protein